MDHDPALIHTGTATSDLSGSSHVLVVTRNPALIDVYHLGEKALPSEVATIDGIPVDVLKDPQGRRYYRDPQTGKTYHEGVD